MKRLVKADELTNNEEIAIQKLDANLKENKDSSHLIIRKEIHNPNVFVAQSFTLEDLFDMVYSFCQSGKDIGETVQQASQASLNNLIANAN